MNFLALLQVYLARFHAYLHEWSETDEKACRASGLLLLLLTATAVLPPVLVQLATGGRMFFQAFRAGGSGPDAGWSNMAAGYLLPGILLLTFIAITGTFLGVVMLVRASALQHTPSAKTCIRQRYGILLLSPALVLLGVIFASQLPWRSLGLASRATSHFFELLMCSHFSIFMLERYFVIPHTIAVLSAGYVTLAFAVSLLSRGEGKIPSALASRVTAADHIAKTNIHRWIDTDARAYRACGIVSFLFSAILVLPVLWFQLSTLFVSGKGTTLLDIWLTGAKHTRSIVVIPTLLMLIITLAVAMVAFLTGRKMFAKAKQIRVNAASTTQVRFHCKRILQRFAWLLLVIIPIATFLTSAQSVSLVRQINPRTLFATVDGSSWREAKATFLRMQFYPILLLGFVAMALAHGIFLAEKDRKGE